MPIKKRMKAVKNSNEKNKKKFNNTDQALLGFSLLNKPWVYVIAAFFIVLAVSGGVWVYSNKSVMMSPFSWAGLPTITPPQDCPIYHEDPADINNDGYIRSICTSKSKCTRREHGEIDNHHYTCTNIKSQDKPDGDDCCIVKANCELRPDKEIGGINYDFKCVKGISILIKEDPRDNSDDNSPADLKCREKTGDILAFNALGKCGGAGIILTDRPICCAVSVSLE